MTTDAIVTNPITGSLTRRSLLMTGAVAGTAALASCRTSSDDGGNGNGPSDQQSILPAHVPFDKVTPDLEPANEYSVPGFLAFPDPPVDAISQTPGDGTPMTGLTTTSISAAPPMGRNKWWQNLNTQLGADLELSWIKGSEYVAKVQTILAGDDLPEVIQVPSLPRMSQVLEAKFADLTPFLAGDGIRAYPMLANFSTQAWEEVIYNGKIYGIPRPLLPIGSRLEARTDTLDDLGISLDMTDGESFLDLCREITDRSADRFAMVQPTASFLKSMFGLPNVWEQTDQGLRHEIESETFMEYLDYVRGMWDEGLFHPDSFQSPPLVPLFQKPSFVLFEVGGAGFTRAMPIYRPGAPTLTVKPVVAPLVTGGKAPIRIGKATSSWLSLSKDLTDDRIKVILSMINYLAAPFGTQEYLSVQYGLEGHNYNLDDDGQPIPDPSATNELFPVTTFPGSPNFMYSPEFPEVAEAECNYEAEVGDNVVLNPTSGMNSETEIAKGQQLAQQINLAIGDIIQGRKDVSSWTQVVEDWKTKGGDTIRAEFQEQL